MRKNNRIRLTPAHFIPLAEIARLARSKTNCLRKHRVCDWRDRGLAHKDRSGHWWVDPKVLQSVKPVRSRLPRSKIDEAPGIKSRIAHCELPPEESLSIDPEPPSLEMAMGSASPETAVAAQVTALSQDEVHELLKPVESDGLTWIELSIIAKALRERAHAFGDAIKSITLPDGSIKPTWEKSLAIFTADKQESEDVLNRVVDLMEKQ